MNTIKKLEEDFYVMRLKLSQICDQWDVIRNR